MSFCPSFTQSESFLHTNFIRVLTGNVIVNVFKSDAVIWWAAIFRSLGDGGLAN